MPRKANKPSTPAPAPHPYRPLSQALSAHQHPSSCPIWTRPLPHPGHVMTGGSMSTNQFEENVNKSKEIVGEIVDEEIRSSSPDLPSKPWTFSDDQVKGFRENLNGILNSMARVTPRMATNLGGITKELALFVSRIINSEWADVNVGKMSITSAIRDAASSAVSYQAQAPPAPAPPFPIPPAKNVTFAPTPIPSQSSESTPMDVDPSPPRIPAAAKGKGKAPPPPPTPQHPVTTSPVAASPIKISVVPKPLVQPSKTGQKGKPVTSYMPYKLSVVTKPTAINETLAGVTPRMPESGSSQQVMGKDASRSNAPSAVTAQAVLRLEYALAMNYSSLWA
ncbi:hypothetical protein AGABI1DRAFT_133555 [Agaricus bisporus var. burnettii JB137-S8]|uniref:Uncharacterized protein n=1 Tax=Agaricus bisporus var. burnettii (strain JB137-S8 / ATCC MYA-4627 / FGSC 10392) TaxID=597362 RepID=K5VIL8_AGABU|nr:uncharacterized protein AGABI1DRAFT_133555 [Agaricus bisporus var. burnettii JB137-S8]EKM74169.1 hypothetical protein AGABI1DRAFT_133555 [Agaricus bisporus var. burnettii JB137-S8]